MQKKKRRPDISGKDKPLIFMSEQESEEFWDGQYCTEEGIITEFVPVKNIGKVRSLADGAIYHIDDRQLIRTEIELRRGDKVLFAPFGDTDGGDYARIIRVIERKVAPLF